MTWSADQLRLQLSSGDNVGGRIDGVDGVQLFGALEPATEAALRASIERFGVLVPVTFDQRGRMIDGHHRWRIASELRLECPWGVRHVADDDEAAELARTLNMDRRHLDPGVRRAVAAALRRDGHNLRAIAQALGVDPSTVLRDVRRVANATPDLVRGRDNKLYPPSNPSFGDLPVAVGKPDLGRGLSHPARFGSAIVAVLLSCLFGDDWSPVASGEPVIVVDPFAGTGRIHELAQVPGVRTLGIEIEPEWARLSSRTVVADALSLPLADSSVHAICTSPTYGNRHADHHEASDPTLRRTYRHDLGRELHANNSGRLQWGLDYRALHMAAWQEATRVLIPGGRMVLNIKDHLRAGRRQHVAGWHVTVLCRLGLRLLDAIEVESPGMRSGANGAARMPAEMVFVFELEASG